MSILSDQLTDRQRLPALRDEVQTKNTRSSDIKIFRSSTIFNVIAFDSIKQQLCCLHSEASVCSALLVDCANVWLTENYSAECKIYDVLVVESIGLSVHWLYRLRVACDGTYVQNMCMFNLIAALRSQFHMDMLHLSTFWLLIQWVNHSECDAFSWRLYVGWCGWNDFGIERKWYRLKWVSSNQ